MAKGRFALDIRKFAEKVDQNLDQVVRSVTLQVGTSLVERSPVGNPSLWKSKPPPGYVGGRFRANWQLQAEQPSTLTTDTIDQSGQATIGRFTTLVATMKAGGLIYFANSLPYARRIEDGWSGQAPAGVVEVTAIEFQDYVNKAVQALPK